MTSVRYARPHREGSRTLCLRSLDRLLAARPAGQAHEERPPPLVRLVAVELEVPSVLLRQLGVDGQSELAQLGGSHVLVVRPRGAADLLQDGVGLSCRKAAAEQRGRGAELRRSVDGSDDRRGVHEHGVGSQGEQQRAGECLSGYYQGDGAPMTSQRIGHYSLAVIYACRHVDQQIQGRLAGDALERSQRLFDEGEALPADEGETEDGRRLDVIDHVEHVRSAPVRQTMACPGTASLKDEELHDRRQEHGDEEEQDECSDGHTAHAVTRSSSA